MQRPTICASPECIEPLPEQTGRGRPRLFCSPKCRGSGTAREAPLAVEVDHEHDGEDRRRPVGRVWLVKMRRGRNEVVVARDLGRPSADHLASQIAELIGTRRQRKEVR